MAIKECKSCGEPWALGHKYCGKPECLRELKGRGGRVANHYRDPNTGPKYVEVAGIQYLVGPYNVAYFLQVPPKRACSWVYRRHATHFPWPIQAVVNGVPRSLYDPEEVKNWYNNYNPSRGGAPKGPRNGSWIDGRSQRKVPLAGDAESPI